MIYLENSIIINEKLDKVFKVVQDIEKYPDFIPEFKSQKILTKEDNKIVIERTVKVLGLPFTWISNGIIKKNESIKFEQIKGLLKGMSTEWIFEPIEERTKIKVIHTLDLKIPFPIIKDIIGRFLIWDIFIKKIANKILENLKKKIELERGIE